MFFTSGCSGEKINMVLIPDAGFEISQTEITQAQFSEVMKKNPSIFKGKNLPVDNVSWFDAIVFCNKLSIKEGLTPVYSIEENTDPKTWSYSPCQGKRIFSKITTNSKASGYRLPTNDEWLYAAYGGEETNFSGSDDVDEVAWFKKNSNGKPHPVAKKKPNGYGLYDMSGNVWEWTENYHLNQRMFRGGSWDCIMMYQRIDAKFQTEPYYRGQDYGFRVVKNAGAGLEGR